MTDKKKMFDPFFWLGLIVAGACFFDLFANLGDWTEFFWFCPLTSGLLAFALFRRNALIVTMCLFLAIPAQVPWILDFLLTLVGHGMGRTAFILEGGPVILAASVITHSLLIPVALWAVFKLGFHRRALLPGMMYTVVIQVASFLLTPTDRNVNCVFYHCDVNDPGAGYLTYFLFRSLSVWLVIITVSFFSLKWLFRQRIVDADNA